MKRIPTLLGRLAFGASLSLTCSAVLVSDATGQAATSAKSSLEGTWQGTLHAERDLRTVIKIVKQPNGFYQSSFFSIDQGGQPIPVKQTTLDGSDVRLAVEVIRWRVHWQAFARRWNHRSGM